MLFFALLLYSVVFSLPNTSETTGYLGGFFLRATWILKIRRKCKNFSLPLILYACEMIMNVRAMCTDFFLFFCLPQSIGISLG